MKAMVSALVLVIVIGIAVTRGGWGPAGPVQGGGGFAAQVRESPGAAPADRVALADASAARRAFEDRAEGRQLVVTGRVTRILPDDRDGSPHQRFIIATDGGPTLLVAHNLDLAPRLEGLNTGEEVRVYGEYEWNPQGGVMHWTHDDPRGAHPAGYIEWRGRRYQ